MIVMMKKRDFFLKFRRRAAALLLAMNMALGSVSGMVLDVQAASVVKFNFVEIGQTGDGVAELVAGSTIPIVGNVPADYKMNPKPPFYVRRNSEDATPQEIFKIDDNTSKWLVQVDYQAGANEIVTKDSGTTSFKNEPQYSLEGMLVSVEPEKGKVSLTAGSTNIDSSQDRYGLSQVDIEVDAPGLGITKKSGFKFSLKYETLADFQDGEFSGYSPFGKPDYIDGKGQELLTEATGWFKSSYTNAKFFPTVQGDDLIIRLEKEEAAHSASFHIKGMTNFLNDCIQKKVNEVKSKMLQETNYDPKDDPNAREFKLEIEFDVSFEVPQSEPLILQVLRPVEALDKIRSSLESDRDAAVDQDNQKLITIADGDSLIDEGIGISKNFSVKKSSVAMANSKNFNIEWSWVPENLKEKDFFKIIDIQENNQLVLVKPDNENVKGFLVARIFYTPTVNRMEPGKTADDFSPDKDVPDGADIDKFVRDEIKELPKWVDDSKKVKAEDLKKGDNKDNKEKTEYKKYRVTAVIPITVLGTGDPPKVNFEWAIRGQYKRDENAPNDPDNEKQEDIPEPFKPAPTLEMGTYDGGSDPHYYPVGKLPPYKFTGHLDFGRLGGKAERLVIRQTAGDGEVEIYLNDNEKYTLGTEIRNEEEKNSRYSVPFMIKAVKPGAVTLKFDFYNRAGDIFQGSRNEYSFQINIKDNSPIPDPTLKALPMKAVLKEDAKPLIKETFYKNFPGGVMDYGFQSKIYEYGSPTDPITVPNATQYIAFTPEYTVERNKYPIEVTWVRDVSIDSGFNKLEIPPKKTVTIPDIKYQENNPDNEHPDLQIKELNPESVYTIRFKCTAETGDIQYYTFYIKREEASDDAFLKSLSVYPDRKSETPYTMEPEFKSDFFVYHKEPSTGDPENKKPIETEDKENVYEIHVPYRQKKEGVDVRAVSNNPWASEMKISPDEPVKPATVSFLSRIAATINAESKEIIQPLNYDEKNPSKLNHNLKKVFATVLSEDGQVYTEYELHIYVNDPSENDRMQEPKISYWINGSTFKKDETDLPLVDGFDPEVPRVYTERVPFSTTRFRLVITPEDYLATNVTIGLPGQTYEQAKAKPNQTKPHQDKDGEPQPLEFILENEDLRFDADNQMILQVWVDPEYPGKVGKPYTITIEREEPNRDNTAEITLTNTTTNAQVTPDEGFDYNNIVDDYDVEIEYVTDNTQLLVQVVPTAPTTKVEIEIDGKGFKEPRPDGALAKLTPGKTTQIKIRLTPEDTNFTRIVTINVKYLLPSKNCYLKDLKAGTLLFRPIPTPFDKKKLNYKIEIPKGMTTIPITAWLLDDGSKDDSSKATITINDKKVGNGEPYNFTPSEKTGKIKVVVTAQDGKTKRTYTISYKNWNMLKPNDEDMLKDLWVDYADMQPKFDSSITEYEVYLKPEAMDIKVYPKLRDSSCKIEVTAESKVLTEFEDYYSTSLMDDEMDIHVYVWSEQAIVNNMSSNATGGGAAGGGGSATVLPDKEENPPRTTAREYVLHLYRNDEEKIGNFKPLPAEDVDFVSSDPIVIDITQYPIISADVFKTLKEDYPDKSIIFKGNDYTLQIFGADIDGVIPNVESFDLRFSFRTPDEKKIRDAMDAAGNNSHIEPVYYYFNQHGALPAEMLLTVDLGRHYSNETLFWNYYNQERDRIDYYGYVHTNAKGTFSVPISHFSTYLSTDEKIRGAENKSDEYGNPIPFTEETENLNSANSANKDIPNTAAPISFTVPSLNQTSAAQQPVPYTSSSAGSVAARTTAPAIDMALPERKKLSPVRKKSTDMPTGILK